jgi:two-component system, NtrC family, response regulator AtoC
MKILIIDDDAALRKSLTLILGDEGFEVVTAGGVEDGLRIAREEKPGIVLCDVRMPGGDGLDFLDAYRAEGGTALVLMMTAYGSLELALDAMGRGAYDYLPKPFGAEEVLLTVRKAVEREQLRHEVGRLRAEVQAGRRFGEVVARSPAMLRALELAGKVARHPSPIMITGATGTGKELVARLIHAESERSDGPLVPVNCGAIPETLLESEFFGYIRGAFTGADGEKEGLFEAAHGGTLFLDEVGELPATLQVKLLRALQEGEVRRLGGTETRKFDVRVISATNRNLDDSIREGSFREDLYYRLAVVTIHLPPLVQRKEEIPVLAAHFLSRQSERLGVALDGIDPAAMDVLVKYPWPGNIRELENVIERAVILAEAPGEKGAKRVSVTDLPEHVRNPQPNGGSSMLAVDDLSVKRRGAELESRLIRAALERTGGNRTRASELLELSDRALRYKIREYGLD